MVQFLGLELAAQSERLRRNRLDVAREFQRHSGDVGSPEVMGESCTACLDPSAAPPFVFMACLPVIQLYLIVAPKLLQWLLGHSGSGI